MSGPAHWFGIGLVLLIVLFVIVVAGFFLPFFRLWLQTVMAGAPIPLPTIVAMRLLVDAYLLC